jgi:hypothetical protein
LSFQVRSIACWPTATAASAVGAVVVVAQATFDGAESPEPLNATMR